MSLDSAFLNLVRGNRISTYLGLTMEGEIAYRFAADYSYVEIPLSEVFDLDSEKVLRKNAVLKKGQTVRLIPACQIQTRNYKCLVSVNPVLQDFSYGTPGMFLIDAGDTTQPSVTVTARKDCSVADLTSGWLVRLYLLA